MKKAILLSSIAGFSGTTLALAGGEAPRSPSPPPPIAAGTVIPPPGIGCDDSLKIGFHPDAQTQVTMVKAFHAGDDLHLGDKRSGVIAAHDVCMIKLNVGPGNPGPADAPSTSKGIGIEIWLPAPSNWTGRIHALGGGGFVGLQSISSLTALGTSGDGQWAGAIAATEGSISTVTDGGHVGRGPALSMIEGSFAMKPDGSVNGQGWKDFSSRAVHEMVLKAKGLAKIYYGVPVRFAYWDGCSTGGRQGLKEAQAYPADFDGILAGSPAINWTRFITAELYPQVVMQRDLEGKVLSEAQLKLVSAAAVSACDTGLNGQHDGFITDPAQCRYDPTRDRTILCEADGGVNGSEACVTTKQALAINKMWYGQTVDGSVPDPFRDNGVSDHLQARQLWYGVTRGTQLGGMLGLAASREGAPAPFSISTNQIALEMQKSTIASSELRNKTGNGADGWKLLSYADLARAQALGQSMQLRFGNINSDDPDLRAFRARGGKLIQYHGLADQVIFSQGSTNYYARVAQRMGGYDRLQQFYRYYQIPGMGHCHGIGSVDGLPGVSPAAEAPLPAPDQLFSKLVNWVEKDQAPSDIVLNSASGRISRPICAFPAKTKYIGGNRAVAMSYRCA